jgi:hypothetical protein
MRCYACHQPVGANARFCSTCGATLAFAAPTQPQQPFAAPAPSRVQPQQLFATPLQPQQPFVADPANGPYSLLPYEQQQLAPRMGPVPFASAPFDEAYAAFNDAAPAAIPLNYGYAPAGMAAPYGYAPMSVPAPPPAPVQAQAPSMVNNVMVTQLTPPAPAPTVVVDASGGGVGVALRALFFLLTGIALGAFWVGAVLSGGSTAAWALLVAAAATVAVLLLDIAILNRYPHR